MGPRTEKRRRLVLVLCTLSLLFFSGVSPAEARGKVGDTKRGGAGHGGAGATHVPIVDDDILFMVDWTRQHLQAEAAHTHATGAGVVVAVLDGGFNLRHPWIEPNLSACGYDAVDKDSDPEDLGNGLDDDGDGYPDVGVGHGTFVAGMVLLAAPDATILPVRVRDDEGWGTKAEIRRGLLYAWMAGADVVNVSGAFAAGGAEELELLIEAMRFAGVAVIVSAGNDGLSELNLLAGLPSTLAVGSTDAEDKLAPFSNFSSGATPAMLLAPGVDLYGPLGIGDDGSSGYWSGTSFSAGLVSGAAALVLEATPAISPDDLFERLLTSSTPAFNRNGKLLRKTGRIDLFRAVTE